MPPNEFQYLGIHQELFFTAERSPLGRIVLGKLSLLKTPLNLG